MTSIIRSLMLLMLLWLIIACALESPSSVVMPSMSITPYLGATATFEAVSEPTLKTMASATIESATATIASTATPPPLIPTVTPTLAHNPKLTA